MTENSFNFLEGHQLAASLDQLTGGATATSGMGAAAAFLRQTGAMALLCRSGVAHLGRRPTATLREARGRALGGARHPWRCGGLRRAVGSDVEIDLELGDLGATGVRAAHLGLGMAAGNGSRSQPSRAQSQCLFFFLCFVVHLQHQLPMFRASPRVPNALSQFMIFGLRKQPLLFLSKQPLMFFVFGTLNEFKWKNDLL